MKRLIGLLFVVLLGCGCGSTPPPQENIPPPKTEVKKGADGAETTITSVPNM